MTSTGLMARVRRSSLKVGAVAFLSITLVAQGALASTAKDLDEYATWDDVVAAQGDIDAQNALIDEINAQIDQLQSDVAIAEQVAIDAGDAYSEAADATTEQNGVVYNLQTQADEADQLATQSEQEAGAMVAAMSNRVTVDPTVQLLTKPGDADDFLMGMSTLSKLGTHNGTTYETALSQRNNAEQLGEQANAALGELERLEAESQAAYESAVAAQQDLQNKRDAAINEGSELEAMLIPLMEHRDVVEADYEEGERLREEERQRIERERQEAAAAAQAAAEAAAAEAAAQQQSQSSGGGGSSAPPASSGGGGSSTPPASSDSSSSSSGGSSSSSASAGFHYPMSESAWITSPFGYRMHPVFFYWKMHNGIDLVVPGGTCWAPIYAVADGTVGIAGWAGGYGNMVSYTTSDGSVIQNGHISEGGINVYVGQYVSAGDVIGYAGTTGDSTGCHLHFEILQGGSYVDPVAWLNNRGMYYY